MRRADISKTLVNRMLRRHNLTMKRITVKMVQGRPFRVWKLSNGKQYASLWDVWRNNATKDDLEALK